MEAEKKPSKYNKERRTDKVISVEKVIDITNGNSEKKAENAM
jgi:hypothetical protein